MNADEKSADALFAVLREEHWEMAVLFQRLSEGFAEGLAPSILARILESLTLFFSAHSTREENYLAVIDHPRLMLHQSEHAQGVALLQATLARCTAGQGPTQADVDAISALFTEILFVADARDLAGL